MPIEVIEQIHDNPEWSKFLDSLTNQEEKDLAGKVMNWIKTTYPEFKNKLNGKLIAEITRKI